jgi:tetratricopeptide (TPR) repeat protein
MGRDYVGLGLALVLAGWLVGAPGASVAAEAAYDSGGTGTATRQLADARRAAYHGRYTEALADINTALALAPHWSGAWEARSNLYVDIGRYDDAASDLDHVIAMHPDAMWLPMRHAEIALRRGDGTAALAYIKKSLTLPLFSYWHDPYEAGTYENGSGSQLEVTGQLEARADEYSSIAEQLLHQDDASLADMAAMMKLETQHPKHILASYCYLTGIAGLLESAELACQQSIDTNSHDIGQYDSLGYVHLRMKQWDKAIADYNKAIDDRPDLTISLYGRGVARRAKGDIAGGNADIAAATREEPDIAAIMKRLGVTPL